MPALRWHIGAGATGSLWEGACKVFFLVDLPWLQPLQY